MARQGWRSFDPVFQIGSHRLSCRRGELGLVNGLTGYRCDAELAGPARLGLNCETEDRVILSYFRWLHRGTNVSFPHKVVALVAQHHSAVAYFVVILTFLFQRILNFKEIGEIGSDIEAQLNFLRLVSMIQ